MSTLPPNRTKSPKPDVKRRAVRDLIESIDQIIALARQLESARNKIRLGGRNAD